jgi:hypothetical protein
MFIRVVINDFAAFELTDWTIVVITPNHLSIRNLMAQAVRGFIGIDGHVHRHVKNIRRMRRKMTFSWRLLNFDVFLQMNEVSE